MDPTALEWRWQVPSWVVLRKRSWSLKCVPSLTCKNISCCNLVSTMSPHLEYLLTAAPPMGLFNRQPTKVHENPPRWWRTGWSGREGPYRVPKTTHLEQVRPGNVKRPAHVSPLAGDLAQVSFLLVPYLNNPVKVVWVASSASLQRRQILKVNLI